LTIFISPLATPARTVFGCSVVIVRYEEVIRRLGAAHDLLITQAEDMAEAQLAASAAGQHGVPGETEPGTARLAEGYLMSCK
jgi:hypothetical protein